MKVIKFRESLSKLILAGEKNTTWRLFDDKDLQQGDIVSLVIWETNEVFAKAKLTTVYTKELGKLEEVDWEGHERYSSDGEMYKTFEKYYQQ